ncbi:MAG: GNAT family N-acetyltransferase [Gammaproteobacteria bacterium]
MHKSMTMEFARPGDAREIAELSREYIEYDLGWEYTPEKITRIIRNDNKNVVIARDDGRLTGFGIMTYGETNANLDLLAVRIRYRYLGIGRWIVEWLEKVALTAGIVRVSVQVRQQNLGAIEFYKKLGYEIAFEQRGYYRGQETAIIMTKDLRSKANRNGGGS